MIRIADIPGKEDSRLYNPYSLSILSILSILSKKYRVYRKSITSTSPLCSLLLATILCLIGWNDAWAYGENTSYVCNDASEKKWLTIGDTGNYSINGPAKTLSFEAKRTAFWGISGNSNFYAEYSTDGGNNWTKVLTISLSNKDTWYSFSCEIPENSTNVRMITEAGATGYKQVRNVKVTRLTTLSTSTSSLDFGTQDINVSSTKQASIDFNNTTYNQQVTGSCTDNHFSVMPKDVGETGTNIPVDIVYTSTTPGIHSGTVTLNMNGKQVSFSVSGTSQATYNFSANAEANNADFGSASASVEPSIISTNASESKTAIFTATANEGYEFVGWGTTPNATAYESTDNPYLPVIENSTPNSTANKTLYAIFCPVFRFAVNADKIYDYGNVSASVTDKVLGNPSETSASTQANFVATPHSDCTFEGWYLDREHTQLASENTTYTQTLTNNQVGSTENLTLYAWFKSNQTITWNTDIKDFNLVQGTTADCSATSTGNLPISYNSSNAVVASVDENGLVTGNAVSNDGIVITASQKGNDEFNAAPDITRTFYVLEKLQASFSVIGFAGNSPIIKVEDTPYITLFNVDEDFTFSSSDNSVVSISRNDNTLILTALQAGTSTITLSQPANATHNASSAVYNITVERHQGGLSLSLPETMKVGDNISDFWTTGNTDVEVEVTSSNPDIIAYSDGKLTAMNEGTAIITVFQAENNKWAGESRQQTITVSKVANTLSISLSALAAKVEDDIAVEFSNQNNTETPITLEITEQALSTDINNGTDVIAYADGTIRAGNAGTVKLKFHQAASAKYEAYTSPEYEITVTKYSNPITVSIDGGNALNIKLKYGETASLAYTSANTDTQCSVSRTSGSYTTLAGNTITAGDIAGTDTYEIAQAETFKYEPGYASFSIRVNNTDEALGYVLYDETEYFQGTGAGVAHTYELSGPGEVLYYSARIWAGAIYYHLYVEYSVNGTDWIQAQDNTNLDSNYKDFSCTIPEEARYVRFRFPGGGTLRKLINNVKVPRKTYVRASSDKTDLGTVYTGNTSQATFTVDYSSTNGGNIHVSSNNVNFVVSEEELIVADNSDGKHTFTVTYTPNPAQLGPESALISISDLFYNQDITLNAEARKQDNTLEIIGEQNLKVGDVVENVYFNKNSDAELSVSMSNEGIVSYDIDANRLTAIGEGTVTLTIFQKATDLYQEATKSVIVNVGKHDNTLVMSLDKTEIKVEETAQVNFANKNSDGLISASYTVDGIVEYNDGVIYALKAGTVRIILTQAATVAYPAVSQSFDITVSKHDQILLWDNELSGESLNLKIGQTLDTNTATAGSGLPVSYSSSNPAALSVDASTGLLTALSGGANIVITATQAGNYKYNEASITRNFTVISKINATVITSLSASETNELTVGEGSVTIGCSASLTEENFSVSGENASDVISTTFANNTLTITPLKSGTVTVSLNRAEDDSYYAVSETYIINVLGARTILSPDEEPYFEYRDYAEISLNRTFRAGYSSLALPFNTSVGELVGIDYDAENDWLAQLSVVTYNAHDGYTLYFRKVADGQIRANEPYILHLAAGADCPVFRNIRVEEPVPGEHTATGGVDNGNVSYTQWTMKANYTPGMSMQGMYGIAGDRLMLGGSASTINAYTAYIVPPASAPARVRIALQDEEGNTTDIISVGDPDNISAPVIYNLNGVRSRGMQPGINIVRESNGSVRKVIR